MQTPQQRIMDRLEDIRILLSAGENSRELSLAKTKLDEFEMWFWRAGGFNSIEEAQKK